MHALIRKAGQADIKEIVRLIYKFSSDESILFRDENEISLYINTFYVASVDDTVIGIVSYHDYGMGLYEIRSLAVDNDFKGIGAGKKLIEFILLEITKMKYKKIFVLTYIPEFFIKFGFRIVAKATLPEKIWKDCSNCTHRDNCDETALILE